MVEIGIDALAIALMCCWAAAVFLLSVLFEIERRKLKDKLETLKTVEYRRRCFSIDWWEGRGRLKIIGASGIHLVIAIVAGIYITDILFWIFRDLGYALFVAAIGLPIFLDFVFEEYSFSRRVRKEKELQANDKEYMEDALKVLTSRARIYSIVGVVFLVAAPFTPQLFNLLPFVIANFARLPFLVAEKFGVGGVILAGIVFTIMIKFLDIRWVIRQIRRGIHYTHGRARESVRTYSTHK